jgi:transcriptional regulator with XRE-family HTH domain
MNKTTINSERLKALRSRSGLKQKELAGKVGVDVGTLSRWERGAVQSLRRGTFGKLVEALKTTPEVLRGEAPPPDKQPELPQGSTEKINLTINLKCRNALNLIAIRYGVTRQQVVEAAPLLFYIAAEKSLEMRRTRLRAYVDSAEATMAARPIHLAEAWAYNIVGVHQEEQSINAHDLFAARVSETDDNWNEWDRNPFAEFLSKSLREVLPDADTVFFPSRESPDYKICKEEAGKLVGGDENAATAILSGIFGLHELPRELREATPEERAEWIRAKVGTVYTGSQLDLI